MKKFKIIFGRPDGIGNRIEQIIRYSSMFPDYIIFYVWNNLGSLNTRSYPSIVKHKNVKIIPTPTLREYKIITRILNKISRFFMTLNPKIDNKERIDLPSREIIPKFHISFKEKDPIIGLHIRGTDRISINPSEIYKDQFLESKDELLCILNLALTHIKNSQINNVFICGDENGLVEYATTEILKIGKKIVRPITLETIDKDFIDFFGLSLCNQIVLGSKFSSFSLTAALIGNIPVKHFGLSKAMIERYKVQELLC